MEPNSTPQSGQNSLPFLTSAREFEKYKKEFPDLTKEDFVKGMLANENQDHSTLLDPNNQGVRGTLVRGAAETNDFMRNSWAGDALQGVGDLLEYPVNAFVHANNSATENMARGMLPSNPQAAEQYLLDNPKQKDIEIGGMLRQNTLPTVAGLITAPVSLPIGLAGMAGATAVQSFGDTNDLGQTAFDTALVPATMLGGSVAGNLVGKGISKGVLPIASEGARKFAEYVGSNVGGALVGEAGTQVKSLATTGEFDTSRTPLEMMVENVAGQLPFALHDSYSAIKNPSIASKIDAHNRGIVTGKVDTKPQPMVEVISDGKGNSTVVVPEGVTSTLFGEPKTDVGTLAPELDKLKADFTLKKSELEQSVTQKPLVDVMKELGALGEQTFATKKARDKAIADLRVDVDPTNTENKIRSLWVAKQLGSTYDQTVQMKLVESAQKTKENADGVIKSLVEPKTQTNPESGEMVVVPKTFDDVKGSVDGANTLINDLQAAMVANGLDRHLITTTVNDEVLGKIQQHASSDITLSSQNEVIQRTLDMVANKVRLTREQSLEVLNAFNKSVVHVVDTNNAKVNESVSATQQRVKQNDLYSQFTPQELALMSDSVNHKGIDIESQATKKNGETVLEVAMRKMAETIPDFDRNDPNHMQDFKDAFLSELSGAQRQALRTQQRAGKVDVDLSDKGVESYQGAENLREQKTQVEDELAGVIDGELTTTEPQRMLTSNEAEVLKHLLRISQDDKALANHMRRIGGNNYLNTNTQQFKFLKLGLEFLVNKGVDLTQNWDGVDQMTGQTYGEQYRKQFSLLTGNDRSKSLGHAREWLVGTPEKPGSLSQLLASLRTMKELGTPDGSILQLEKDTNVKPDASKPDLYKNNEDVVTRVEGTRSLPKAGEWTLPLTITKTVKELAMANGLPESYASSVATLIRRAVMALPPSIQETVVMRMETKTDAAGVATKFRGGDVIGLKIKNQSTFPGFIKEALRLVGHETHHVMAEEAHKLEKLELQGTKLNQSESKFLQSYKEFNNTVLDKMSTPEGMDLLKSAYVDFHSEFLKMDNQLDSKAARAQAEAEWARVDDIQYKDGSENKYDSEIAAKFAEVFSRTYLRNSSPLSDMVKYLPKGIRQYALQVFHRLNSVSTGLQKWLEVGNKLNGTNEKSDLLDQLNKSYSEVLRTTQEINQAERELRNFVEDSDYLSLLDRTTMNLNLGFKKTGEFTGDKGKPSLGSELVDAGLELGQDTYGTLKRFFGMPNQVLLRNPETRSIYSKIDHGRQSVNEENIRIMRSMLQRYDSASGRFVDDADKSWKKKFDGDKNIRSLQQRAVLTYNEKGQMPDYKTFLADMGVADGTLAETAFTALHNQNEVHKAQSQTILNSLIKKVGTNLARYSQSADGAKAHSYHLDFGQQFLRSVLQSEGMYDNMTTPSDPLEVQQLKNDGGLKLQAFQQSHGATFNSLLDIARNGLKNVGDLKTNWSQRTFYVPEVRQGDYKVRYKDNGVHTVPNGFESEQARNNFIKKLQSRTGITDIEAIDPMQDIKVSYNLLEKALQVERDSFELVKQRVRAISPIAADAMTYEPLNAYSQTAHANSVKAQFNKRKFVAGRETIPLFDAGMDRALKSSHSLLMTDVYDQLQLMMDDQNVLTDRNDRMYAQEYITNLRSNRQSMFDNVRRYFVANTLANLSTITVEMSQNFMVTPQELVRRGSGFINAQRAAVYGTTAASKYHLTGSTGNPKFDLVIKGLADKGLVNNSSIIDNIDQHERAVRSMDEMLQYENILKRGGTKALGMVDAVSSAFSHFYEHHTKAFRTSHLLASLRAAELHPEIVKPGAIHIDQLSTQDLSNFAGEVYALTAFPTGQMGRPPALNHNFGNNLPGRIANGLVDGAYMFKSYTWQMYNIVAALGKDVFTKKGMDKVNAAKAGMTYALMAGLFSGAARNIDKSMIVGMSKALGIGDDEDWEVELRHNVQQLMGDNVLSSMVLNGIPETATGVNISSRLSLGNPFPQSFDWKDMVPMVSFGANMLKRGEVASKALKDGEHQRVFQQLAGIVGGRQIGSIADAVLNDGKVYNSQNELLYEPDVSERFVMASGFTPKKLADVRTASFKTYEAKQRALERENKVVHQAANALSKDETGVEVANILNPYVEQTPGTTMRGILDKVKNYDLDKRFPIDPLQSADPRATVDNAKIAEVFKVQNPANNVERVLASQFYDQLLGKSLNNYRPESPATQGLRMMKATTMDALTQAAPTVPKKQLDTMLNTLLSRGFGRMLKQSQQKNVNEQLKEEELPVGDNPFSR
jgi:hypothetical protein